MKKISCILVLLTLVGCHFDGKASEYEKNAYVFVDRLNGKDLSMCIIYEDHYYVTPLPEHYEQCPCQITEFYFREFGDNPNNKDPS